VTDAPSRRRASSGSILAVAQPRALDRIGNRILPFCSVCGRVSPFIELPTYDDP
jgi:hypothetical protein